MQNIDIGKGAQIQIFWIFWNYAIFFIFLDAYFSLNLLYHGLLLDSSVSYRFQVKLVQEETCVDLHSIGIPQNVACLLNTIYMQIHISLWRYDLTIFEGIICLSATPEMGLQSIRKNEGLGRRGGGICFCVKTLYVYSYFMLHTLSWFQAC
jgi:hypothetical protein